VQSGVDSECARLAKEIGPIRSDRELYRLIAPRMKKEPQEVFYVVCVDVHGDLVGFTEVARGQVSRVAVDVEDVLQCVLSIKPRPTAYAICHNHPSSKVRPSEADKKLTEAVRAASKVAAPNTVLLDHIIVGGGKSNEYYSFADGKVKRA
jgi:DNA repair protein RadC